MKKLLISDSPIKKIVRSPDYNFDFDKKTGMFVRWGKTFEDDPLKAPAPEILDLEISYGPCSQHCEFCSPAKTKVNTPNGETNIEDLKKGDLVISYEEQKKCVKINTIEETYERYYEGELIILEIENGRVLKLTPEHPVFIKEKGWVLAKDLTQNMEIINF